MKNPKVVLNSFVALLFIYLTFAIDWLFIIPALVIVFINQKLLIKK